MEYLTFRIGIIGASQTGKTTFVLDQFVKNPKYNFKNIFLCGLDHNIKKYKESLQQGTKLRYLGYQKDHVIGGLYSVQTKLAEAHKLGQKLPKSLVIFDDLIDPEFIRSQTFINFMTTSRHYNIYVIYLCHSPTVVLTPLMKNNLTVLVLCDYAHSSNYDDLLSEFFDPILIDYLVSKLNRQPTKKEIAEQKAKIIGEAFNGHFGKLIINKDQKTFSVIAPTVKSGDLKVRVNASDIF